MTEEEERSFRKITEEEAENKKDGWEIGWICVVWFYEFTWILYSTCTRDAEGTETGESIGRDVGFSKLRKCKVNF